MKTMNSADLPYFSVTNTLRLHSTLEDAKKSHDDYVEQLNWDIFDGNKPSENSVMFGIVLKRSEYDSDSGEFR